MNAPRRGLDALLGVVYIVLVAAFVLVAVLVYQRTFVASTDIELSTGKLGNALQTGSDVKLRGVPVGVVTKIDPAPDGATLTLALDPETTDSLPQDTTARLLPKTLFGERYVSLVTPVAGEIGLSDGDQIVQDDSDEAVELEQLFDELLPLLQSIQPEKLSASLGELATALRGRGDDIGDTLATTADYLEKLNPQVPDIAEDLERLGNVADVYDSAAPDLLDALDTLTVSSGTLVDKRSRLTEVYARVISSADTTTGFVSDNRQTIEVLADESRDALAAVRPYANQFPCLFRAARDFIPRMDSLLGKGTNEPGLHVQLNVVEARGKYLPGRDAPEFSRGGSPRCPYVEGRTGTQPASASASAAVPETIEPPPSREVRRQINGGTPDLGAANSPGENQLIAELVAPTQGLAPAEYPAWSSLVVGPSLRGTEVSLQ
ncbi:MCE family protein [Aeromicrobium sp. CF3.5]|uniref:MCE family protein n=1 Tax=Aeromicrobium sp. CF3.5 TaxID=3373078 RepID=UPI003EE71CC2